MKGEDDEFVRLMRAACAGDTQAYDAFLRRTAALVRGFVRRRMTVPGLDPEDIVQETLIAVHLKRHTWRDGAGVKPWLFAIARHKLADAFRRRGRRLETPMEDLAEFESVVPDETGGSREIERALAALAPVQRLVVTAVSVEGRSIGETARHLGMRETAVRVALHRGLKAIANRFGRT